MIEQELNNITLDSLPNAAQQIIATAQDYKLWAFYGEMGAGKTTLIKAICKELGVSEAISSPTFSLVNEYKGADNNIIYHFDFYRIKSLEEVYDIGYEDYFYSGNLCLIEWPEKVEELITNERRCEIHLSLNKANRRNISINIY